MGGPGHHRDMLQHRRGPAVTLQNLRPPAAPRGCRRPAHMKVGYYRRRHQIIHVKWVIIKPTPPGASLKRFRPTTSDWAPSTEWGSAPASVLSFKSPLCSGDALAEWGSAPAQVEWDHMRVSRLGPHREHQASGRAAMVSRASRGKSESIESSASSASSDSRQRSNDWDQEEDELLFGPLAYGQFSPPRFASMTEAGFVDLVASMKKGGCDWYEPNEHTGSRVAALHGVQSALRSAGEPDVGGKRAKYCHGRARHGVAERCRPGLSSSS
jgi:hypothetical protein